MSQARNDSGTSSFDREERAALKELGFGFDCTEEGHDFATLKGHDCVDVISIQSRRLWGRR